MIAPSRGMGAIIAQPVPLSTPLPATGRLFSLFDPVDYAAPGTVANSPICSYTRTLKVEEAEHGEASEN